jgi:sugar lactone lactonase YvrE
MSLRALPYFLLLVSLSIPPAHSIAAERVADEPSPQRPEASVSFELAKPALCSAGVYDAQNRLVQVLWTKKDLPAGTHAAAWDGKDQFGQPAPAGEYQVRVVLNRSTYKNVGAISNSGRAPTPEAHTPTGLLSVAVDSAGAIYTANGWDEAGADFKKWDARGNAVYDARYQIRNGDPNGAPYAIAVDDAAIYCAMGGWASPPWNHKQQLQRFSKADGKHQSFSKVRDKAGHIQLYEWPEKLIPPGTPPADAELMREPLRAVAVAGEQLLVADALAGKVRRYDKLSGEPRGEFPVPLPHALAVDRSGRVWVGHQHKRLSLFSADGKQIAQVLDNLGEIASLAFGPSGELYLADRAAGQVKVFDVASDKPREVRTHGRPARAGDRQADRYFELRGAAVDPQGHLVTIQTEPAGGARLARWSPDGNLLWEHFGCEFVSLGNYGRHAPDMFYSMTFHRYRLTDPAAGRWDYTGCLVAERPKYHGDVHGVPRLLRLEGREFWFMPTGDGLQVYRLDGQALRLACLVGGGWPDAEGKRGQVGQWTWSDTRGDGRVQPQDIRWFKQPGQARYAVFGLDVDSQGNIWFGELHTHAIWTVPLAGLDPRGNPTYDWAKAREAVPKDLSPLEFQPNMAQRAEDGSIYALGWSKLWPSPKDNPFWMGGTTLVRFDAAGRRLWAVPLAEVCVGMDAIPGGKGGAIVGSGRKAELYHFTADGLLVGSVLPGEAMAKQSGWFDNHACVAVNRDFRDGLLDVFTEDDFALRLGWYRIDDRLQDSIAHPVTLR